MTCSSMTPIEKLDLMCEAIEVANSLFEKATDGKYYIHWKTKYDEIRFECEHLWLYVYDYENECLLKDNRELFLNCLVVAVSRYPEVASDILQEALFGTLDIVFPETDKSMVRYMEKNLLPKERRLNCYTGDME